MVRPATVSRDVLLRRIHSEYQEMPGLRLTCEQAQRLWGLDHVTCRELLEDLVRSRYLTRTRDGRYARWTDQLLETPLRMAQATLKPPARSIKRVS